MDIEQRIEILEKGVIWLMTGYKTGDKVLYYDTSNKIQYTEITEMRLGAELVGFVPRVYCTLKNLEDNKTYFACAKSIGRKLTNFDLQGIDEKETEKDTVSIDEGGNVWNMDYNHTLDDTEKTSSDNNINHPKHYTQGDIECIDYIEDKTMNYRIGNAVKYLTRYKDKGAPIEDLEKAKWYIGREIENLKEE